MLRNIINNNYRQYDDVNVPQHDRDEYFMSICLLTAHYSPYDPKAVVIVKDDEIIVTGRSNRLENGKISVGPMSDAIYKAVRNGIALQGSKIYMTHHPANISELVSVGIKEVIYLHNQSCYDFEYIDEFGVNIRRIDVK
jgi:deoxycytidylate deaminase